MVPNMSQNGASKAPTLINIGVTAKGNQRFEKALVEVMQDSDSQRLVMEVARQVLISEGTIVFFDHEDAPLLSVGQWTARQLEQLQINANPAPESIH